MGQLPKQLVDDWEKRHREAAEALGSYNTLRFSNSPFFLGGLGCCCCYRPGFFVLLRPCSLADARSGYAMGMMGSIGRRIVMMDSNFVVIVGIGVHDGLVRFAAVIFGPYHILNSVQKWVAQAVGRLRSQRRDAGNQRAAPGPPSSPRSTR